jgi:hypothetical protein
LSQALKEIAPGLAYWTAPHPAWKPGAKPESPADWPEQVGSVLYEAPLAVVMFDPQLPPDPDELWPALDDRVAGRPVVVLTTIRFHGRSLEAVVERYDAQAGALPAEVEAFPLARGDETVFWLPEHAALVAGDRILGDGAGGLRMCPESWLGYIPGKPGLPELREELLPLLDLPVERVLVTHGEPVLEGGHAALARALSA